MLVPDPETLSWVEAGNVVCEGVTSPEEAAWLRAQVAPQEDTLQRLLARNHAVLFASGIVADVIAMDRQAYRDATLDAKHDVAAFHGISEVEAERLIEENGTCPIHVDGSTQFRVAENILLEEPCDPSHVENTLYVVIYNGPDPDEQSVSTVGTRIANEGQEDIFNPAVRGVPGDLWLSEQKLATVGSLVDIMKAAMAAGRLPDLGESGYYDTLVVSGLSTPLE